MSAESVVSLDALFEAMVKVGLAPQRNVPIGPLTTYRVGGAASLYVQLDSEEDLEALASLRPARTVAVVLLGKGSNMLVSDSGFAGLAVVLGDGFGSIEIEAGRVVAGAAVSLPILARQTVKNSLTGFEWAVGVPGSIGGAVRMNAGGHKSEMSETLVGVRVVDLLSGHTKEMQTRELELAYRHSCLEPYQVVTAATLQLEEGDAEVGTAALSEIVAWRRENQPGGANAGSVFTNPDGHSAGQLIDAAGLKGHRIGTARVSEKHANFIQADQDGLASDVIAVMVHARQTVSTKFGIELHPETRLIGFTGVELSPLGATGSDSHG